MAGLPTAYRPPAGHPCPGYSSHPRCFNPTALRWFLGKYDVQDVIEEMQEEKRSLASVETVSVWHLLLDPSVRWQVLSVVVINMGMQLSGIDAVRAAGSITPATRPLGWASCIFIQAQQYSNLAALFPRLNFWVYFPHVSAAPSLLGAKEL